MLTYFYHLTCLSCWKAIKIGVETTVVDTDSTSPSKTSVPPLNSAGSDALPVSTQAMLVWSQQRTVRTA